jgi:hypothetical protein
MWLVTLMRLVAYRHIGTKMRDTQETFFILGLMEEFCQETRYRYEFHPLYYQHSMIAQDKRTGRQS